eukprot:CAMPEP_0204150894 /NCGR_PEP_ID=MMETSP0361-20130328/25684_1 /ASSEMBLY_ACC=CAM_ASM_000343 /TAXON_ID=268821 /ORGANISM="Scrippsiella Hangoei, Strain SHTV-5" /LENGTH=308 /DNA_ID=CAMNT_0051105635 /DNA_START=12 /DNA_END=935 /DNA_ORIENTATION=-
MALAWEALPPPLPAPTLPLRLPVQPSAAAEVPWRSLGGAPRGALGRFVAAVGALLETEAVFADLALAVGAGQCASELREVRAEVRRRGSEAIKLQEAALRRVEELGRGLLEAPPVNFAIVVDTATLVQLCHPGVLGINLELQHNVGSLRGGWRLLGGMSLASVAPHVAPLPLGARAHALQVLQTIAQEVESSWFAFCIPPLDAVSHHMFHLDAWRNRWALVLREEREVERWQAKEMLEVSTQSEKARFLAKGFDPAAPRGASLKPAHLEHRIHWSEYRDAERLRRAAQRRTARADRASTCRAASTGAL